VIVEGDDLIGDGVNIAARGAGVLPQLARAGPREKSGPI